ncbi:histidine phosphatase family protein [Shewanella sp. OMA3-2]|uniref:histidine phosphatase family protein n=1 Tax=Shewanella sp. OMA3-2 TaxID=2908650 RepID=UPI001F251A02|nr:histidine phosphatase family protein [Shewanella sp. OMA3-2]UJF21606.1 histidine phosphatase family protein [Shewanella sp. OMA3-2]
MKHLQLVFLRHGHCQGGDILRGKTDVALSEQGQIQMQQALDSLALCPAAVYSSPLKRCAVFSDLIAKQHRLPITLLDSLQEIDFGQWDGKTWQALYQQHQPQLDAYWSNPWQPDNTPPDGEHLVEFSARVKQSLLQIISQMLNSIEDNAQDELFANETLTSGSANQALIVTHGGVMRCVMAQLLGAEGSAGVFTQFQLPYAALMEVDVFIDSDGLRMAAQDSLCFENLSFRLNWPSLTTKIEPCYI